LDKLKTLPDQSADNALYLGSAIHKAFETGRVEDAIAEYRSNFYVTTDLIENEIIKLEYYIPKVLALLPEAECEVELSTDSFIGYIDRLIYKCTDEQGIKHFEIWDYKYANPKNFENYLHSSQLSLYKAYFEETHENCVVDNLVYVLIPKIFIRQKKDETLYEFRQRLQEHLEASEIKLMSVPFDSDTITDFQECCQHLSVVSEFPKNPTRLCDWCEFKEYCQSDGEIDWDIVQNEQEK
jgi:hypothetical protein